MTVLEIKSMPHKVSNSEEKMVRSVLDVNGDGWWGIHIPPTHREHYSNPAEWGQRSLLPRQSDALEEMSLKLVQRKTYSTYITPHIQVTFPVAHMYFWKKKMDEIYHKSNSVKPKETCCSSLCPLLLSRHTCAACRFLWNVLCLQQGGIYKAARCRAAIEMLRALRKTVANPGIDALFEIGWTIWRP